MNNNLYVAFWLTLYGIILLLFVAGIAYIVFLILRRKYNKVHQYDVTFLQVRVPSENEIEMDAADHFFSSIYGIQRGFWERLRKGENTVSFEIVSKDEGIGFYIVVPDELVTFVEKQINANYPDAEIDIIDPNEIWDRGKITEVTELKLRGAPYLPIKTYEDMEKSDPMSTITSSISKLGKSEVVAVQIIVSPAGNAWRRAGRAFIGHIHAKEAKSEGKGYVDKNLLEAVEKKIGRAGFNTLVRIVAIGENKPSTDTHIRNLVSSFEQFTDVKYNKFVKTRKSFFNKKAVNNFIHRKMRSISIQIPIFEITLFRSTALLNTQELATMFHFPNKNIQTPNIMWLTARRAAAPSHIPQEGLYLGKNAFRGVERKIYLKEKDRARHLYIIGQTGTGKSVFMSSLAYQDIINGHGVAYIDPHGSEIDKLLQQIPEERMEDVILFDAADTERPMGLNLLEAHSEEEKHMLINSFIALLYKLYDPHRQGIMGPLLERAIRNVMLTAMADPSSTMADVLRLLIDKDYINKFLPIIKDPLVKRYWTDEVANTSENRKGETMGYFVSKFDRLVTEATMRNIIGQPSSAINFPKMMAEKKIFLANLSKGKIGEENSDFLGLLLVPRILSAALARSKMISEGIDFPDFYLYVDEFQNFATDDFATILSEARKYKLNLTVAHQFISQLDEDIREAIFGNVGTMTVFRIGIEDAEIMESQFEPTFQKNDLINNVIGSAYTRLLIDGHPSQPFSLQTDWPWISSIDSSMERSKKIREMSRQKYGRPKEEVEKIINERIGVTEEPPKPKIDPKKLIPF